VLILRKTTEGVRFLLIWHSKYSAILSKIHSYRLLFRWFCPLGLFIIFTLNCKLTYLNQGPFKLFTTFSFQCWQLPICLFCGPYHLIYMTYLSGQLYIDRQSSFQNEKAFVIAEKEDLSLMLVNKGFAEIAQTTYVYMLLP